MVFQSSTWKSKIDDVFSFYQSQLIKTDWASRKREFMEDCSLICVLDPYTIKQHTLVASLGSFPTGENSGLVKDKQDLNIVDLPCGSFLLSLESPLMTVLFLAKHLSRVCIFQVDLSVSSLCRCFITPSLLERFQFHHKDIWGG